MASRDVLAILVAHASGSRIEAAVASAQAQTHPGVDLVVARVGDVALTKRPGVRVRALPPGTGFAAAVNDVVAAARGDHEWLLILHDDVELSPDVVEHLLATAAATPDAAAVGAKLVEWDRPDVLQELGSSMDRFAVRRTGLDSDEVDHGQHDSTTDALFCSAACLLVRREAFNAVGGLDADAWPLYEDMDLCWRLRRAGHRVVVAPRAKVRHAAELSRGMRRSVGRGFGAVGIRMLSERGRLRFMLKNYAAVSLALILPQYLVVSLWRLTSALVRREFWRLRAQLAAWVRVAGELPRILERRREAGPAVTQDQELLRLASRRALLARRADREGSVARMVETVVAVEGRLVDRVREPVTWAAAVAAVVVALAGANVLWGGTFNLGELRPPPTLSQALADHVSAWRGEGLDPAAPGGGGIVLLGLLASLVRSGALAQKIALLGPLLVAALGGSRLARVLGTGEGGRRWLAVLVAVNPVTLLFVREGLLGASVMWAATPWFAAAYLSPPASGGSGDTLERVRWRARWALVSAATVALHPPALVWLLTLWVALAVSRRADGAHAQRVQLLVVLAAGAFVGSLPSSILWLTSHTPLIPWGPDVLDAARAGVGEATFGVGLPLVAWLLVALVTTAAVGATRSTIAVTLVMAVWWAAGAARLVSRPTAAAAVGWCVLLLLTFAVRRVRDELPRYELGWRQAMVFVSIAVVAGAWLVAGLTAASRGADPRLAPVLSSNEDVGRVLWLRPGADGTLSWVTEGFDLRMSAFPAAQGPEMALTRRAVQAGVSGRIHRLGAVLALGDISHVVVLGPPRSFASLERQADLAVLETQADSRVYGNEAWVGPAMLLTAPPRDPLGAEGLSEVVRAPVGLEASRDRGTLRIEVPADAEGVVYLAGGRRSGWRLDGHRAAPAAAGAWVEAGAVASSATARAPLGWMRALYPLQAIAVLLATGAWLVTVYFAAPEPGAGRIRPVDLRRVTLRPAIAALPLVLAAAVGLVAYSGRASAVPTGLVSVAWYCPPIGEGRGLEQQLAIVNPSDVPTRYLIRPSVTGASTRAGILPAGERITTDVDPVVGAVVEAFGRDVGVASVAAVPGTAGATTLCTSAPPQTSLFAEGGRAATDAAERLRESIAIHNPFPEVARASVRYFTSDEAISPPQLQDVRIPPGETRMVDHEDQLEPQPELSTEVTIWQGRAVVARRLLTAVEVVWSLGTESTTQGVFPRAQTLGATTRVVAVNAGERPTQIRLGIVGDEGSLPPTSFEVGGRQRLAFDLGGPAPEVEHLMVRLSSDMPVGVESVVVPTDRRWRSVLPVQTPATSWVIPAAEGRVLVLGNPGTNPIRVRLSRLGQGPDPQPVTVEPFRIVTVDLGSEQGRFGLLVQADGGEATAAVAGGGGAAPGLPR